MKIEIITPKHPEFNIFSNWEGSIKSFADRFLRSLKKLAKQYQTTIRSLTALLFTGSLFLGGSYLFFVQLAEYGW